jgi:ABC-type Zn2+ transport system substrate-binding protein/surface adhesin
VTLPSLEDLPSTFSRKVHPAKLARKRDRERDKEEHEREREKKARTKEKDRDDEDDEKERERKNKEVAESSWLPWEISRWGAEIRANPAYKMTKKSGKVLTTNMWNVSR